MIARSIGAAPRQRGSSEGCTLRISCVGQQRLLDQRAEGAHDDRPRGLPGAAAARPRSAPARPASLTLVGLREREPERARRARRPAAASRRPRPRGRSGRVITSAGRCSPLRASRSSTAAANSEVPRKTVAKRAPGALAARRRSPSPAPRASRASPPCAPRARCGRGSGRRRGGRSRAGSRAPRSPSASISSSSPLASCARTRTRTGRSTSTWTPGRLRQPSSATSSSSLLHSSTGLTSAVERVLGVGAVDEHAVQHAELGRGQADPERVVHQLAHPLELSAAGARRSARRGPRWRAARGRRSLRTTAQRRVASGPRLGIELGGLGGSLLALDLDVRVGGTDVLGCSLLVARRSRCCSGRGHRRAVAAYCGSTSTLKLTPRARARRRAPARPRRRRARRRGARPAFTTSTWRSRPRRRNSDAGPSTRRRGLAPPAARASRRSSAPRSACGGGARALGACGSSRRS